ncbi:uncharacterized protein SPPG_05747 [Spizellomyces punctatus DAOM BR117]|uniref:Uncharacterized protein n=1 Tax=Spizellomyces punctatus (strain DAOM BR117) TaxID=645134 RepID=A0A0L0HB06_SPIPD|nr:uncharacterized protein SPPG_05747 [Spizellomyces punctatus DAOM BR117]KNC98765.1 hypothetical protein SPPG_05747 [Spizellomyces punctatus DAOM BR117]|eukprot:XP_016606805.1 hypothetical protein SPPG_05747 [Spizellomyces punctatus DAOM BR117]
MDEAHHHPRASTSGPLTRGAVTGNYYTPTIEEKAVIDKANKKFVATYATGIFLGITGGATLVRYRKVQWNSMQGLFLIMGCTMTGEVLGRKGGEARAREALSRGLPPGSKLRELLEKNSRGLSIPKGPASPPTEGNNDFSLEGTVPPSVSPVAFQKENTASRQGSQGTADEENAVADGKVSTSWEQIRRKHSGPSSTWDRIRTKGAGANASETGGSQSEPEVMDDLDDRYSATSDPIIPRTRDELLESERKGQIRRNNYGDLSEPVVASVGGRGLLGPYGDTVAATPAGNTYIPRTREELEATLGRRNVKRNEYGDLVE